MAAMAGTIWLWNAAGGAAATSLPHRRAARMIARIALCLSWINL
jgi:hypothetical protein